MTIKTYSQTYCDNCGSEIDQSYNSLQIILNRVEQASSNYINLNIDYHEHQNGGSNIVNGDLCLKCVVHLLNESINIIEGKSTNYSSTWLIKN